MSVTKEKILYKGVDNYLKVNLGSVVGLTGEQQEIDKQTQFTTNELVNGVKDGEVRRFKTLGGQTFNFKFRNNSGGYGTDLTNAGFTSDEISMYDLNLRNSFFIFDFFSTADPNNQTRLFRTFLTKIKTTSGTASYQINKTQLDYIYIPISTLEEIPTEPNLVEIYPTVFSTLKYVYLRILFYNAKSGKISVFLNENQEGNDDYEKYYFQTRIYPSTIYKRWYVKPIVNAKEIASDAYTQRVRETAGQFENQSQNYPNSSIYNPKTNTYEASSTSSSSSSSSSSSTSGGGSSGGGGGVDIPTGGGSGQFESQV